MVAFDTNILLLLLERNAKGPIDPSTGKLVRRAAERIERLIDTLSVGRETIIIPAPVLTELLAHAGTDTQSYLDFFEKQAVFKIAPFGRRAAIEAGHIFGQVLKPEQRLAGVSKHKIKFDLQIIATAKVERAHTIYSDNKGVQNHAGQFGLRAYGTVDIPLT